MATFKQPDQAEEVYEYIDEVKVNEHVYQSNQVTNNDDLKQDSCKKKASCNRVPCTLVICVIGFVSLFVFIHIRTSAISTGQIPTHSKDGQPAENTKYSMVPHFYLVGYNILRGFPLTLGQDYGFTDPIFGETVYFPVVSCENSFSSKVIHTRQELDSFLSTLVYLSGDGLSFSGHAQYHQLLSQIGSGKYLFIFSTITCTSLFTKLAKAAPPKLHPNFLALLEELNNTDDKDTYFSFYDIYGTHFPTMISYGAKLIYQHKMASSVYQSEITKGINVASRASSAGDVSIGRRDIIKDTYQLEQASHFKNSVETKIITVGVPPLRNGDIIAWASHVRTSPLPIKYDLEPIENLLTDSFISEGLINNSRIVANLKKYQYEYCLRFKQKGEISSCTEIKNGLELFETKFNEYFIKVNSTSTFSECVDLCIQNKLCTAVTYCISCANFDTAFQVCYMYHSDNLVYFNKSLEGWVSGVFIDKVKIISVNKTSIVGTSLTMLDKKDDEADLNRCRTVCLGVPDCVAFSYCKGGQETVSCKLYDNQNIIGLKYEVNSSSYFVQNNNDF